MPGRSFLVIVFFMVTQSLYSQLWNVSYVGSYNTPDLAAGVTVSGNYAYVADGYAGLRIIDVSNPAAPQEAGFYDTPGFASGVAVSGDYAYVAEGYFRLRIIDVSNPAATREVGSYNTLDFAGGVVVIGI